MTQEQPRSPTGVIGHDAAVSLLERSVEAGRYSHAYIFVGPQHVGKMALALHLAKAVNCTSEGPRPCRSCSQCRRIASGQHADVQIVAISEDEARGQDYTRIRIETIRELQRQASLHPYEGACRVFIIDEAELLSLPAANSLLKTLEEPPPSVLLILLTSDEASVLATILSRCQRIELRPMTTDGLERALITQYGAEEEKARLVASLSGGCPGWAISAAGGSGLLDKRVETLDDLIALAGQDLESRFRYATRLSSLYSRDRRGGREVFKVWLTWWRDLILAGAGLKELVTNAHRMEEAHDQCQRYSLASIRAYIQRIAEAAEYLERNASARLVLEWLMLKFPAERNHR